MVNLANSQLQEDAICRSRLGRRTPLADHEIMDTIPNDTNLVPVNVRRYCNCFLSTSSSFAWFFYFVIQSLYAVLLVKK